MIYRKNTSRFPIQSDHQKISFLINGCHMSILNYILNFLIHIETDREVFLYKSEEKLKLITSLSLRRKVI